MCAGQRGHHRLLNESHKGPPISFAIFCSLEASPYVQPTLKGYEHREGAVAGSLSSLPQLWEFGESRTFLGP